MDCLDLRAVKGFVRGGSRSRRRSLIKAAIAGSPAIFVLFVGQGASAYLITWANSGVTWSTGSNWVGGVAPANSTITDAAVFVNSPTVQPFLSGVRSVGSIDFQSAGWIISGSTLTFGSGGGTTVLGSQGLNSTTNATGNVTFNNGINLSASQIWT